MTVPALGRLLLGERRAIGAFAASRWSLPIGFAFVIAGAFARHYDREDFLADPTLLLHGPLVSIVNALLFFSMLWVSAGSAVRRRAPFGPTYLSFLGLFWLTAPMAWLYAIPYERFLTPVDAVTANAWTLGAVSIWRVLLASRFLSVLLRTRFIPTLIIVYAASNVILLVAMFTFGEPLTNFMGGFVVADEAERLAQGIGDSTAILGILSLFISVPAALIAIAFLRAPAPEGAGPAGTDPTPPIARPSRALVALSAAAILLGVAILPFTQPPLRRATRVARLVGDGQPAAALRVMTSLTPDAFPRRWSPLPPAARPTESLAALIGADDANVAPWARAFVAELAMDKVVTPNRRYASHVADSGDPGRMVGSYTGTDAPTLARILRFTAEHHPSLSADERANILSFADAILRPPRWESAPAAPAGRAPTAETPTPETPTGTLDP